MASSATLVVALALGAASVALVQIQRSTLTANVREAAEVRADDISRMLHAGDLPPSLGQRDSDIAAVQVVDARGVVVSATSNLEPGEVLSLRRPPPGSTTFESPRHLPIDEDPFLVLARGQQVGGDVFSIYVAATLDPVNESATTLTALLLVVAPAITAFVGLLSWRVAGAALAPVEAIRREVAEISSVDVARRVREPRRADEIGRLARTMNAMLERLYQASERQNQFVADAAHELRSPLASLRVQLEAGEADGARVSSDDLLAEVVRLQHLADDLLLLARLDERQEPMRTLVDLDDVVLTEVQRSRAARPNEIDTSGVSAGQVRGDPGQLERVVRNLLDNAQRHASARIAVTLQETGQAVVLSVANDGPSIDADDADRIFERFVRLDSDRGRESGGAGLGLAIAQTVVEAHGGTIVVDPGYIVGARFVVHLPAASAADGAG